MLLRTLIFGLLSIALFSSTAFAQKDPMKWGKVDEADRKMTVYEQDSSASAVILCDFGTVEFDIRGDDFKTVFEHHKRIKILNEEGYDQADIEIPFYKESENITGLKAHVILPDGSTIDVNKKDIFTEEISEYWSSKKIAFPNIVPGAIIEYRYKLTSERILELREWYFEYGIPVRWSEFRTAIPEWFDYIVLNQGTAVIDAKHENSSQHFSISVSQAPGRGIANQRSTRSGIQQFSAQVKKSRYVLQNAPALYPERYISTMDDYRTRLRFQLQSVQFPNSSREPVLTSWPKLAKDMTESTSFGQQYLKKRNFKDAWKAVEPQLASLSTDTEKAQLLYQFVLDNVKWNESYSIYTDGSLNDCYKKKLGYSGELNLLLLGLLKEAGITAYPILISTRSHGKAVRIYPIIDQFNHVIVYANIEGKETLIDASDPVRPMNYLRVNSLNSSGWLVDPENPQWVNIAAQKGAETLFCSYKLDEEGNLKGDMKMKFEGYAAVNEREKIQTSTKGEHWKKRLAKTYPDVEFEAVEYKSVKNIDQALTATIELDIPEVGQVSGDFIYINPLVYSGFSENPFKIENRTYPVDIPYPISEQDIINIELPEGFDVEEVPESTKFALPENAGTFQYMISQNGNKIQLVNKIKINRTYFEPENYASLRNFFEMVIEKQSEQIILKKRT